MFSIGLLIEHSIGSGERKPMIGFNLKISELKGSITEELIARARGLSYGKNLDYLNRMLRGESVFYTGSLSPWDSVLRLIEYLEAGKGRCQLLYDGGYPYLFTAQGKDIVHHIADADRSQHTELRTELDPETFYLIEAWDLS